MRREQVTEALALLAKTDPRKTVDALVSAFDRMMAQRNELLEALHGEATEIDGQPCWCSQPNMIKYRGHDSGCESNRELVKRAEGES